MSKKNHRPKHPQLGHPVPRPPLPWAHGEPARKAPEAPFVERLVAKIERAVPEPKGFERVALMRATRVTLAFAFVTAAICALLIAGMHIGEEKCGPRDGEPPRIVALVA